MIFGLSLNCFKHKEDKQIENDIIKKLSPSEATALLISQRVDVGSWNKIYNREFLKENNIKFSEDLFFGEGLRFITTVSQLSQYTAVGLRRVYYYRQNNNSSATKKFNCEKYINGEKSLDIIKNNLIVYDEEIEKELNTHYCLFYMNAMLDVTINKEVKKYNDEYKYWKKNFRKLVRKVLFYDNISKKRKIKLAVVYIMPSLLKYRTKRKMKSNSKNSID